MVLNTRRRALGLLLAAAASLRLPGPPRALAAKKQCFESKPFAPWKAQATDAQAGARITEVSFVDGTSCDLRIEIQVAASFEGKLVIYGDPDQTPLPKKFLIEPDNRLIARNDDGTVVVDEPLCGNCTDIFADKVSLILPLACAPLFREAKSCELAVKLGDKEECRFKLDCETLRKALDWASERKEALAALAADEKCERPEGCFITTACCETLGLDDDCFELRTLRRYRDQVLAMRPGGADDIAFYYRLAPLILARLPDETREQQLRSVYARFILPSALAAKFGFDALAHRLNRRMIDELIAKLAPEQQGGNPAPSSYDEQRDGQESPPGHPRSALGGVP
jgi:hypothetical protein